MKQKIGLMVAGVVAFLVFRPAVFAQQSSGGAADESRLVEKVKEAVLRELREGNFLAEEIERGIQRFIKKQEAAQAAARVEQERLAGEKAKKVRRVSASRDHIYGDANARVSLIEYSDFECPFCKEFHRTPKQIVDAYAGKVNWVYRHFPIAMHNPGAQKQAEASECAAELGGNAAFWKYAEAIYARTQSNGNGFPLSQLVPLAKEIGLDEKRFTECLEKAKYQSRVQEDFREGIEIGIGATPTNILLRHDTGEVALKIGAQSLDAFKQDIERLLAK